MASRAPRRLGILLAAVAIALAAVPVSAFSAPATVRGTADIAAAASPTLDVSGPFLKSI